VAAQQQDRESTAQLAGPAVEADPLGRFTCPVCLEVYEKPVRVACGHVFCSSCLSRPTWLLVLNTRITSWKM
uniref:RING-type domain-containing protein n=1 Tax=Aotus nancymaae TaxID=37293 RepID=A0A2K5EID0_AOTNA